MSVLFVRHAYCSSIFSCIKKWHAGKTCDGKDTNDEEFKVN